MVVYRLCRIVYEKISWMSIGLVISSKCFDTRNRTLGHVIRSSSAYGAKPRIRSLVPRPFSLIEGLGLGTRLFLVQLVVEGQGVVVISLLMGTLQLPTCSCVVLSHVLALCVHQA